MEYGVGQTKNKSNKKVLPLDFLFEKHSLDNSGLYLLLYITTLVRI